MAKKSKPHNLDIYQNLVQLFSFLKRMKIGLRLFMLSAILSVAAVLFNVLTIRLLFPLLKGMVHQDFSFIETAPFFKWIIAWFPQTFSTSFSLFLLVAGMLMAAIVVKNALSYLATLGATYQGRKVTSNLRKQIFDRYLSFGKLFYDRRNAGRLSTILVQFPRSIGSQLNALHRTFAQILSLIAYFAIMLAISWKLTLWTMVIFPPFLYGTQWFIKKIKGHAKSHVDSEERLDEKIANILSTISLVKAHGMEEEERKRFTEASDEEVRLSYELDQTQKLIGPIQDLCMMLAFVLVACVILFATPPQRTEGLPGYLVFLYLLKLSLPGLGAINQFLFGLARTSVRITKVSELLDHEEKQVIVGGARHFGGLTKGIVFDSLRFSYRPKTRVLQEVTFSVEKGKRTAIVGPTGAGKTTLIHLLLRFYDCPASSILVDGIDIRDFSLKSLSDRMAYVSQDALFFNDTLRANVTYGLNGGVSDEMIMEAAKKTSLYDFIMNLPEQLDTQIGDRAAQLSGGEKQRMAITRALLREAEILIMDEATSALDSETEQLIREAFDAATRGRTSIVIAHRMSTIKNADKIVVVEEGKLVEEGSLEELLEKKGRFHDYWEAQKFF